MHHPHPADISKHEGMEHVCEIEQNQFFLAKITATLLLHRCDLHSSNKAVLHPQRFTDTVRWPLLHVPVKKFGFEHENASYSAAPCTRKFAERSLWSRRRDLNLVVLE